jgi:hypothetical protein
MTAVMQRHLTSVSWCGILILCLAICFQLLGVPGTLFNVIDSEDDFQSSVAVGYTIASGIASMVLFLKCVRAFTDPPSARALLRSSSLFHPPLFP